MLLIGQRCRRQDSYSSRRGRRTASKHRHEDSKYSRDHRERIQRPKFRMPQVQSSLPEDTIEILTERLMLRKACDEDAEALNAAFSDPEVMRFWSDF
jgi:RimJ/RimL family protein N-acetyltransferase